MHTISAYTIFMAACGEQPFCRIERWFGQLVPVSSIKNTVVFVIPILLWKFTREMREELARRLLNVCVFLRVCLVRSGQPRSAASF